MISWLKTVALLDAVASGERHHGPAAGEHERPAAATAIRRGWRGRRRAEACAVGAGW